MKFYVSGADREGEGEFKIFEHIHGMKEIQNNNLGINDNPIHYSSYDSDLTLVVGKLVVDEIRLFIIININIQFY